jgi:hypothetical protein
MAKRKLSSVLVLLLAGAALPACGEPDETCTCTCACGSGETTTLETESDEDCSSQCETSCANDSYTTNYDCTTKG